MPIFDSGGVPIHYLAEGEGPAIVLVHGFASSLHGNWRAPGLVSALVDAGRRVVALDCRGHGRSGKPHDPAAYAGTTMEDDVVALLDHVELERADLMGYSMGGYIACSLLTTHAERFRCAILAGIGDGALAPGQMRARNEGIARALEAQAASPALPPAARAFRDFAEQNRNDLAALAAVARSDRDRFDRKKLAALLLPVMVL